MLERDPVLAIVPARGGSKRLVAKNLRVLGDRPLVAWAIDAAKEVAAIDRIMVSTDDPEIERVARDRSAEVHRRPADLAGDHALPADLVRHVLAGLDAAGERMEWVVYLEPTAPFRDPTDIEACLALLGTGDPPLDSAATFRRATLHPEKAWRIRHNRPVAWVEGANPWTPSSDLAEAYQLNGAVYVFHRSVVMDGGVAFLSDRAGAVLMPAERSVDIDDATDLAWAEFLLASGRIAG